jgi:hypothetical protein
LTAPLPHADTDAVSGAQPIAIEYAGARAAVRDDLREAHAAILDALRRPGAWFTGAQRIAIAAESRLAPSCNSCRARKAALSPEQPVGEHDRTAAGSALPALVIEVAHRVRTDSGRLSRAWFERVRDAGLAEGPYVEVVGIVTLLAGIDYFCRALGAAVPPLPTPLAGEPSRHRPAGLRSGIAWVPLLAPEDATGSEADLYDAAPTIPNIARALSSVPDQVRLLQQATRSHYVPLADLGNPRKGRAIDRMQIELVAARVSAINECFY